MKKIWKIVKNVVGIFCLLIVLEGVSQSLGFSLLHPLGSIFKQSDADRTARIKEENEQRELATEPVDSYPAPSSNQSSTVYKCKTKAGKTIIQTQPCEGDASTIDVRQAAITTPEQEQEAERRLEMFREMNRKRAEEALLAAQAREAARQGRQQRRSVPDDDFDFFERENDRLRARSREIEADMDDQIRRTHQPPPSCVPTIVLPGNVDNCGNYYHPGGARSDGGICHDIGGGMVQCFNPPNHASD